MNIFGDKKISFEKRINSFYEDIRYCDKRKLLLDIILITGLFIFGFYVNRGIEIKGQQHFPQEPGEFQTSDPSPYLP